MAKLKEKGLAMFKLRLRAKQCISCAICMDVCSPQAIDMRVNKADPAEGKPLSYLVLCSDGNREPLPEKTMTFPFLAYPHRCNGCMLCVEECPVLALELQSNEQAMDELTNRKSNLTSKPAA